ncbi:uncharacterized protein LOC143672556 isoform X2 [Tamandua tetradactyla]
MLKVVFKDTADKEDSPLMRKSTSGLAANTGSWRSPLRGTDLSQREARGSKKLEVWKRKERSEDLSYCHETETQDQGSPAASPGTNGLAGKCPWTHFPEQPMHSFTTGGGLATGYAHHCITRKASRSEKVCKSLMPHSLPGCSEPVLHS